MCDRLPRTVQEGMGGGGGGMLIAAPETGHIQMGNIGQNF